MDVIPERWLDEIDVRVAHRGADGCGRFRDRAVRADGTVVDVAMVHRRLSIIDHAGGAQPMCHDGGRLRPDCVYEEEVRLASAQHAGPQLVAVAFNGCVYDHADRRAELERLGHTFGSDHADTEVLVQGWRAWGADVFGRVDGMLACAVWDRASASLTVARDRFGEKPVYGRRVRGGAGAEADAWVFASSAAAVAMACDAPAAVDVEGVGEWLVRGYGPTRTPWLDVQMCPAGRHMTVGGTAGDSASGIQPKAVAFAAIPWRKGPAIGSGPSARKTARLLEASVGRRLHADVPVACLLSGGVDSSCVALAATRELVRGGGDPSALATVCVRMPSARYDESPQAAEIAGALGTTHRTVDASATPAADLVALIETMGVPFGDSSLLPTSWAFEAVSAEGKVALTGDGGDELFMGYERYGAAENLSLLVFLRTLGLTPPVSVLNRRHPKGIGDKVARFLVAASYRGYRDLLDVFPEPDAAAVLSRRARREMHGRAFLASASGARRFDVEEHLPGDLLRKVDHASMMAGVEARAPMLARGLSDMALRAPAKAGSKGKRKAALRAYLRGVVPRRVLDGPKSGFAVPIEEWFRDDAGGMRTLLRDELGAADAFGAVVDAGVTLDRRVVHRLLDEHDAAGERSAWPWKGRDHSQRLYALLVMAVWCRALREGRL